MGAGAKVKGRFSVTIQQYRYDDTSAPELINQPGSLVALLDAVLVNGYGGKPSLGWSIAYSDTYKRVYRQPVWSAGQRYLRVDDNYVNGTFRYAVVRGYESMTGIDTGTQPFPTTTQKPDADTTWLYFYNISGSGVPWKIYGDDTDYALFYFFAEQYWNYRQSIHYFGDFYSYNQNDAYRCLLGAYKFYNTITNDANANPVALDVSSNLFVPRNYTQTGSASDIRLGTALFYCGGSGRIGDSSYPAVYPNLTDNALHFFPVWLYHDTPARTIRGILPGLYAPAHDKPLNEGDTFTDALSRTYVAHRVKSYTYDGMAFIRTDSWGVM